MNKLATATAVILLCGGSAAQADERAGGAAIGAVSGALILGPVGAVAGAAIGYVAGASAKSSKPKRSASRPAPRRTATAATTPRSSAPARTATASTTGTVPQESRKASVERPDPSTPPMQGFE